MRRAPRSARSDVDDAVFLASNYGLTPDDWQEDVLDAWLGRRRDGRWSAATCGLAVPRQNGKNGIIEVRELFGMVGLGERFLHTAHEVKTARKAFLRIASFFENERQYPELAALVKEIRKTNGQEAVVLTNGGSVEFIARSRGSGRGFTVDVLVCDEAQDLTDEELAALLPTISAAPLGNPQVILTGTPPDPAKSQQGEVFRRVRRDGSEGRDPRLAWVDYGPPDGALPDVDDRSLWAQHNPALGIRLALGEVERERGLMSPEAFARERLGWWGNPLLLAGLVMPNWPACATTDAPGRPAALGLAVDPDRVWLSLGAATGAEVPHLGSVRRVRLSTHRASLIAEAARIQQETGAAVVLDRKGPASSLEPELEAAGVRVTPAGLDDYVQACADLFDAVESQRVTHGNYDDLNDAVTAAEKRKVGDRWAWARRNGDVSMLEAATLALWGASRSTDYDVLDSIF